MNSCILMAKIISDPELRHIQPDGGGEPIAVTSLLVEFESIQPEQPSATLKVVGWRNMAEEIKKDYSNGDRVIIQGRLAMNVIERQNVKEKKAELVVSRIYTIGDTKELNFNHEERSIPTSGSNNVVDMDSYKSTSTRQSESTTREIDLIPQTSNNSTDRNLDDIPFMRSVGLEKTQFDLEDSWELAANKPGNWLHGMREIWF